MTIAQSELIHWHGTAEFYGAAHGPFLVADWDSIIIDAVNFDGGTTFNFYWTQDPTSLTFHETIYDVLEVAQGNDEIHATLQVKGAYLIVEQGSLGGVGSTTYDMRITPTDITARDFELTSRSDVQQLDLIAVNGTFPFAGGYYDLSDFGAVYIVGVAGNAASVITVTPQYFDFDNNPIAQFPAARIPPITVFNSQIMYAAMKVPTSFMRIVTAGFGATSSVSVWGIDANKLEHSSWHTPFSEGANLARQAVALTANIPQTFALPPYCGPVQFMTKADAAGTAVNDIVDVSGKPIWSQDMARGAGTLAVRSDNGIWLPPENTAYRLSSAVNQTVDVSIIAGSP